MYIWSYFEVLVSLKAWKQCKEDFGVKSLKRSMAEAMESRFDIFEHTDEYILATFLDPRFRVWFYRDNDTIAHAKNLICERVYENLSSIEETPINNSSKGGEIDSNQHTFAQAMQKIYSKYISIYSKYTYFKVRSHSQYFKVRTLLHHPPFDGKFLRIFLINTYS